MTCDPHYDVILIGAGSIGAPTAFALANAGLKVAVVDRVASVGQGSNKKAIGGIRATHSDRAKAQLCLRSIEIFKNWQAIYGDDIEWSQGGYCFVAYREAEERALRVVVEQQQKMGLDIHWLDSHDLLQAAPDLNPAGLIGGSYSPQDGSASPLLAAHAFYSQAAARGATFLFNTQVTQILIQSGRVSGIETTAGRLRAEIVVNAAGAAAAAISAMVHIDLPVRPDAHESGITEAVAHFLNPMIVDIRPANGSANFYFYQHCNGQVIFCLTPNPPLWGDHQQETSSFLPMVARRMVEVMPRLAQLRVRRTWRGLYPMTPDGNPILGWAPQVQGFFQAAGMCGQGFMLGPGVAELITRTVLHRETPDDQAILDHLAPTRLFNSMEMLK